MATFDWSAQGGNAPASYEEFLVPAMFTPFAETLVVRSADALIAVGGGYGTLSEIALALKADKRVVGIDTWDIDGVEAAGSPDAAVEAVLRDLST